jgi:hypothetical protein
MHDILLCKCLYPSMKLMSATRRAVRMEHVLRRRERHFLMGYVCSPRVRIGQVHTPVGGLLLSLLETEVNNMRGAAVMGP